MRHEDDAPVTLSGGDVCDREPLAEMDVVEVCYSLSNQALTNRLMAAEKLLADQDRRLAELYKMVRSRNAA